MKTYKNILMCTALVIALGSLAQTVAAATGAPSPQQVVQHLTNYLKSLQEFSYTAQVTYDEPVKGGKTVTRGFKLETSVHRPDRIRVSAAGDEVNKDFFLKGGSIVLYDKTAKVYGVMPVPADIEGALAKAHQDYHLKVALTDLASPQLYRHLSKQLPAARNLGTQTINGKPCYHLVFRHNHREMQLWIDTGKKPLLRKMQMSEKTAHAELKWTALLSDWNVAAKLDDSLFSFTAPAGVKKIKFLPAHAAAAPAQPAKKGK